MKISKASLETVLQSFSGAHRDVFLEHTAGVQLRFLNGKLESPARYTTEGFSFLSRTGKSEFSASFSGLDGIEDRARAFALDNSLSSGKPVDLEGPEYHEFASRDILADLSSVFRAFEKLPEIASGLSFLRSYDLRVIGAHRQYIIANSRGKFRQDAQYYNSVFLTLVGFENGVTEETTIKITGHDIVGDFSEEALIDFFKKGITQIRSILDATPAPSGVMDVVIGAEAGGTIIHEAIGHGLEADLQGGSVYRGKLGQQVAHESVTVIDDPTRENLRGYYAYDHEGNEARKTYLIKNGILVSYLHSNKTAELFSTESTGHGRREDYTHSLIVRMGSTYLEQGTSNKNAMIAQVKDGIYVAQMGGGQVNEVTGDFVFKVIYGYRIRDGKLAEPIRGANIFGNGPEMLMNIQAIGDDLSYFDGGTCGKFGQHMPVSDATPSILVKLKVTGIA